MTGIIIIIGVDPGLHGAVAFLSPAGELLAVEDMPTDQVKVAGGYRPRISYPRLGDLLRVAGAQAFVEIPQGRPIAFRDKGTGERKIRTPGAAGMLALGETVGAVRMACHAGGVAVVDVSPGAWMKALHVAGKDMSRHIAAQRFPAMSKLFARVKDDGRADATLLGLYGVQQLNGSRA